MADSTATDATDESVANMNKLFHDTHVTHAGKKKSIWTMTTETFGMADGQNEHASDDTTDDLNVGVEKLLELIEKEKAKEKSDHLKWDFAAVPLQEFGISLTDIYQAFVIWSNKNEEAPKLYNITKAFQRLDHYATWMHDNANDLTKEPLTAESVVKAHDLWKMKITHDASNRLVWWIDMGVMNLTKLKTTLPPVDSLRYLVWQAHVVMLDANAQENGLIFVEAMGKIGMFDAFTLVPMEIGTKLDRLTIGSMPIKMKAFYMFHGAKWMHIMLALMRPFMSQKMRQRIICTTAKDDPQAICDKEFGRECIPQGFGGMEGGTLKDLVESKYIKSETFA